MSQDRRAEIFPAMWWRQPKRAGLQYRYSQTFNVHLTPHGGINKKTNAIPISDPLAIALLGYQTGAIVDWEMKDGVNRFQIVSVHRTEADAILEGFA